MRLLWGQKFKNFGSIASVLGLFKSYDKLEKGMLSENLAVTQDDQKKKRWLWSKGISLAMLVIEALKWLSGKLSIEVDDVTRNRRADEALTIRKRRNYRRTRRQRRTALTLLTSLGLNMSGRLKVDDVMSFEKPRQGGCSSAKIKFLAKLFNVRCVFRWAKDFLIKRNSKRAREVVEDNSKRNKLFQNEQQGGFSPADTPGRRRAASARPSKRGGFSSATKTLLKLVLLGLYSWSAGAAKAVTEAPVICLQQLLDARGVEGDGCLLDWGKAVSRWAQVDTADGNVQVPVVTVNVTSFATGLQYLRDTEAWSTLR